jgi:DNA processing protein
LNLPAWLRFTLAPKLSLAKRHALLKAFETPEQVFTASARDIAARLGEEVARAVQVEPRSAQLDAALKWIGEPNHHFVPFGHDSYPLALAQIADPPVALYVQGNVALLHAPAFAIVGSRNATPQGSRDAESIAEVLSLHGLTIVSGMALGIDAAAHRGGLRAAASSVAVLGTGADRIYPRRNEELARELVLRGAIVSEFPLGTAPLPDNFPQRNRIISGLSRGVLVVEAALESGSLITARCAVDQNRDVFAIPASIHSPLAKGCHKLIKEGAKLVERAEDILDELNLEHAPATNDIPVDESETDPLLEAMGHAPASIDQIAARTGSSAARIAARICVLEIEGRVAPVASGLFQRLDTLRSRASMDPVIE